MFNSNLVIFENELSASKQVNLSNYLDLKVIDRSMLILDIFAKRARTIAEDAIDKGVMLDRKPVDLAVNDFADEKVYFVETEASHG